jgi:hypothetical protein
MPMVTQILPMMIPPGESEAPPPYRTGAADGDCARLGAGIGPAGMSFNGPDQKKRCGQEFHQDNGVQHHVKHGRLVDADQHKIKGHQASVDDGQENENRKKRRGGQSGQKRQPERRGRQAPWRSGQRSRWPAPASSPASPRWQGRGIRPGSHTPTATERGAPDPRPVRRVGQGQNP